MPSNSVLERRFERLIWRFRLVSIVPVVLSLMGSVGCFLVGAREILQSMSCCFMRRQQRRKPLWKASLRSLAVWITSSSVLRCSFLPINSTSWSSQTLIHAMKANGNNRNLLSVGSLESLKHNLTNVIVMALIVSAFKK